ncbi:BMA-FCD-2, isoform c [Dirofilaria immitis]|nr:BMA-FCD-2, isoform c [Dirofilaria immitis]
MYRRKKGQSVSAIRENPNKSSMDNFELVPTIPSLIDVQSEVSSAKDNSFENDYSIIDEKEFRQALDRCYIQSQNGNLCKLNFNKVTARSVFEKLLDEIGVEICINGSDEISVYLANSFHDLVKKLDVYCKDDNKRANFFSLFEEEIVEETKLRMYLSPSATEKGYVDTFIRALLMSNSSQAATFELILRKIETYAKEFLVVILKLFLNRKSVLLNLLVAPYLNVAGDSMKNDCLALACIAQFRYLVTIYDCKRVFNSIFDCDLENWRCAPRDALIQVLPEIRRVMLQNLMKLDMEVLPELVAYCLDSIQKNEKFVFRNVLYSLRAHLQIENLENIETGTSKVVVGRVLTKIFDTILKKIKTSDRRYWKDAVAMLTAEKQEQNIGENEGDDDIAESDEDLIPPPKKMPILFDILFYFALMDVNNWSHTIHSIFKKQILYSQHFRLEQLVISAFEYTEFGAHGYKTLFLKLPSERSVVFSHILQHLNGTQEEISTTLSMMQDIAENHNEKITQFSLAVSHKILNFEIEQMISSSSTKEKVWGILGMLMQLQQYLINDRLNVEHRENVLKQMLTLLDERTKYSAYLRTCFYQYFARILNISAEIGSSTILIVWAERLCMEFKRDYLRQFERNSKQCRLEDERYSNSLHKEWLCLSEQVKHSSEILPDSENRVFKPFAHFQLLLALTKLKYLWANKQQNDNFLIELRFILEANISMVEIDLETKDNRSRIINCDIFFFCIQWIRLMLNTFAVSDNMLCGADKETIHTILRKRFALMMECQKCLEYTIQKIGEYKMPYVLDFEQAELIVFHEISKKPSNMKKRRNIINNEKGSNEDEDRTKCTDDRNKPNETEDEESRDVTQTGIIEMKTVEIEQLKQAITKNLSHRRTITESQLISFFMPLSFVAVIHLIEVHVKILLDWSDGINIQQNISLQGIISNQTTCSSKNCYKKLLESNSPKIIWSSIHSIIPTLFSILHGSVNYFKNLLDTSVVVDLAKRSYHADMSNLMHSSLVLFHTIFSSCSISSLNRILYNSFGVQDHLLPHKVEDPGSVQDFIKTSGNDTIEEERSHHLRMERRKLLMEKLERAMIDLGVVEDTQGADDIEDVVSSYFISISEVVPTLNCAVSLLQLLSCDFIDTRQKSKIGKCLELSKIITCILKKEWFDTEERRVKGASLNQAVANILRIYLSFREQTERLSAIQWMLANKISELVPEEERRRSKISSLEPCHDKDLNEVEGSPFICFSRSTFASVYKVLFCSLNETIKNVLPLQAVEKGKLQQDKCFALWKIAASSFCLLTLLIRELRNASVLLTAAREGCLFLQTFVVKSSFMYLLSEESRFAKYGAEANAVLKTVQIGNRSLQNMSAHAKSTKSASLLKLLPRLRATSEQFIRTVHQLMIGVDCDSAFQIGLLKSRNLDGEELKEVELEEGSDADDSQQNP